MASAVHRALAVLVVGAAVTAGCGGDDDEDRASTSTTGPAADLAGQELYVEAGCADCHGEEAEGTAAGPALPGHSAGAVVRQVRSPLDEMPAYSPDELSDEDLDTIAEHIASLAPEREHVEPVALSNVLAAHHWMALSAVGAGDHRDALHHVDHVIELAKGEHRSMMREARKHLGAGEDHEAEHLIEEMLAGTAKPDLDSPKLHLRLAHAAVQARDAEDAAHQVRHFVEVASGERRRAGREILGFLQEANLHDAQHELERLLGRTPHAG